MRSRRERQRATLDTASPPRSALYHHPKPFSPSHECYTQTLPARSCTARPPHAPAQPVHPALLRSPATPRSCTARPPHALAQPVYAAYASHPAVIPCANFSQAITDVALMDLLYPPGDFLQGGGVCGLETCVFIVLFILAGLKLPSLWRLDRPPWHCPWPSCAGHLPHFAFSLPAFLRAMYAHTSCHPLRFGGATAATCLDFWGTARTLRYTCALWLPPRDPALIGYVLPCPLPASWREMEIRHFHSLCATPVWFMNSVSAPVSFSPRRQYSHLILCSTPIPVRSRTSRGSWRRSISSSQVHGSWSTSTRSLLFSRAGCGTSLRLLVSSFS